MWADNPEQCTVGRERGGKESRCVSRERDQARGRLARAGNHQVRSVAHGGQDLSVFGQRNGSEFTGAGARWQPGSARRARWYVPGADTVETIAQGRGDLSIAGKDQGWWQGLQVC